MYCLVVSFDGFPLGYEVFPGNMNDSRTVQTIVTTMEARHGVIGRVWIADRGTSSRANLEWLRSSGRRYIIGAAKSELKKHAALLAETRGWRTLREGVEVRQAARLQQGLDPSEAVWLSQGQECSAVGIVVDGSDRRLIELTQVVSDAETPEQCGLGDQADGP